MIRVFIDASVLFSALYSDRGASYKIIIESKIHKICLLTTQSIVDELLAHLDKLPNNTVESVWDFIQKSGFIVSDRISESEASRYSGIVSDANDNHVIAGAYLMKAHYLVTLDQKHIYTAIVQARITDFRIVLPGDLLRILS